MNIYNRKKGYKTGFVNLSTGLGNLAVKGVVTDLHGNEGHGDLRLLHQTRMHCYTCNCHYQKFRSGIRNNMFLMFLLANKRKVTNRIFMGTCCLFSERCWLHKSRSIIWAQRFPDKFWIWLWYLALLTWDPQIHVFLMGERRGLEIFPCILKHSEIRAY